MSELDYRDAGLETRLVHAGQPRDKEYGALASPIYQTSTFLFDTVQDAQKTIAKERPGHAYSRITNPSDWMLEQKIAAIEGTEDAIVAASGLGIIGSLFLSMLQSGDHIVCGECVYGGTSFILRENLPPLGIETTFVDTTDPADVEAAIRPETKMLYFETVANPVMTVTDTEAMSRIAKKHSLKLVVDNTFMPPPLYYPVRHGVDIVIHSLTKYMNGHGDAVGGAAAGSKEDMAMIRARGTSRVTGAPLAPFNAYMIMRGLKTLSLRMQRHCESALAIAEYLEDSEYAQTVHYPGLKSHPQHALAIRLFDGGFGGMIAFDFKEGYRGYSAFDASCRFLNNLKTIGIGVSLGDAESLIEHPASMTHLSVPREAREASGITDGLIRLSVGLESAADLIEDLEQAASHI